MFYYFSKSRDSIYLLADWNPGARGRVFPLPEEYELFLDSNPQHEQPVLCSLSKQNSILSLVNQFVRGIINAEQLQTSIQLTDRSVHCEPLIYMNEMIGLLYLENSLITSGFPDKSQMLFKLLSNHISVCCGRELLDLQLRQTIKHLHSTHQKLLHLTSIKQQFIHNASSELKLPLNCILDLVALVKENETLEGDKSGLIEMMENSARGLLSIINDILDVKRDHFDVSISAFDLRARLDELVRLSSVNLDPELSLLLDFQFVGSVYLQGDPLLVEHLLLKLLMNAIKFTKKGAIVLRVRLADGISNSSLNNQNVALQFEVTDPGIGISAEQLSNLFSEFTQIQSGATRAYSGTGLGLSVAKKILRTLSGNDASFQVTSKVGVGSTFSFTIPFQCVRIEQTLPREYQVLNGYGVVVYTPSDEVYCSYQGNLLGMQSKFVTQARNFTELAALLTQSDVANTFYCIDVENWEQASNFPLWSEVSRLSKVDECFRPMIIISSKINSLGIKSELFTLLEQMACNYNFLTRPFKQLSLISAMFTTLTKNVTPV
jgi:signal transduction histidine kinase